MLKSRLDLLVCPDRVINLDPGDRTRIGDGRIIYAPRVALRPETNQGRISVIIRCMNIKKIRMLLAVIEFPIDKNPIFQTIVDPR